MAAASLVFPTCCLALSFCFVVLFYNASIKDRVSVFRRRVVLPVYQWIVRKLFGQAHETIPMSESSYEEIDSDDEVDESEEELQPSPDRPWFFPRSEYELREAATMEVDSTHLEAHSLNRMGPRPNTVFFANRMVTREISAEDRMYANGSQTGESGTENPNSQHESESASDNRSIPVSNSESQVRAFAYSERTGPNDLPALWQSDFEQPVYMIDHDTSSAYLEQMIHWSTQVAFAMVAPPLVLQTMDEHLEETPENFRR